MNKKLSAYLETGRISNLPTVWSNVLLSWCLVFPFYKDVSLVLYLIAASLFYVGGCFLGDARDVSFDRENKPNRPIPSGLISERAIWFLGSGMMLLGLVVSKFILNDSWVLWVVGPLLLSLVILSYALFHKKSAMIGLPLIGGCRLLLVVSAFLVAWGSSDELTDGVSALPNFGDFLPLAIAIAIYTICFASVARLESSEKKATAPQLLKGLMVALPCLALPMLKEFNVSVIYFSGAYLLYIAWLLFAFKQIHSDKGAYVSKCLAGFALLDVVLISSTGLINMAICLVLFGLALILQKIAPAT